MSQLLKIFSSEAANSFIDDSLGYASSFAANFGISAIVMPIPVGRPPFVPRVLVVLCMRS